MSPKLALPTPPGCFFLWAFFLFIFSFSPPIAAGAMVRAASLSVMSSSVPAGAVAVPHRAGERVLKIAVEASYPPFAFAQKDGTLSGFDVELTQAVCVRGGIKCQFVNQPFDALISGLRAKKYQAVLGAISATPERRRKLAFSDIYYRPRIGWVSEARLKLAVTPDGLRGVSVATQRGTVFENYVRAQFPLADLLLYASFEEAFLDLQSGRVQAVVADLPVINNFIRRGGDRSVYSVSEDVKASGRVYGFAVGFRRDAEGVALCDQFNRALGEVRKNGTYSALCRKWFV